ncbi:hypothetical protein ACFY05_39750 [Microtetraspora fusca]|uniref:Glycosyltransferase family 4 protein n=1 Tax=Microtetraspora fusca TaxID=1997 RepID=A0ABW6VI02_MICFU
MHLLGPQWRDDLGDGWNTRPVRLETLEPGSLEAARLKATGYDLLVVGHEYPSLPSWRKTWQELGSDVATFQHAPAFQHQPDAFDGIRSRLYCYSPEMIERYGEHRPIPELAVHLGLHEEEPAAVSGNDLLWLGRIDAEKSPHLAVMAAGILRRRIKVVGPVFDPEYVAQHAHLFAGDHVEMVGELGGQAKTAAFRDAAAYVYTCGRTYVEAGAAVFGESLRAGTPVAALTWRPGTCADAALCPRTGSIATLDPAASDLEAAHALAAAIEAASQLDAADVQEIGMQRFDPVRHFTALASRP